MPPPSHVWLQRIYPHNPLYLLSVTLALYGINLATDQAYDAENDLKTSLLFAYIVMLSLAGWLVVRFGRVWEDGRTILLAVLLMFAALSAGYDLLCLNDAAAGARRLALAFGFCAAVVEAILFGLHIRLPVLYRLPFYLQLALLFAFPAMLGRLSLEGRETAMCMGVLGFSVAAAVSLLLLLPAIWTRCLYTGDNGTPWSWPYYPWSIFAFTTIAMSVRLWMLSVSFTHAKGLAPAFHPFFLAPIVLVLGVVLLEIGLRHCAPTLQRFAMATIAAAGAVSFPGSVSKAQNLSLELLETHLAGPPMLAAIAVAATSFVAYVRRAEWSLPVLFASLLMAACIDPETRFVDDLHTPDLWFHIALFTWLAQRGLRRLDMRPLSAAVATGLALWTTQVSPSGASIESIAIAVVTWTLCTLALPLYCRDPLAALLRTFGPAVLAVLGVYVTFLLPTQWRPGPAQDFTALVAALLGLSIAYWLRQRTRWHLLVSIWLAALVVGSAIGRSLLDISDPRIRRGLSFYLSGVGVLLLAMGVSFWKAGMGQRIIRWLTYQQPITDQEAPEEMA